MRRLNAVGHRGAWWLLLLVGCAEANDNSIELGVELAEASGRLADELCPCAESVGESEAECEQARRPKVGSEHCYQALAAEAPMQAQCAARAYDELSACIEESVEECNRSQLGRCTGRHGENLEACALNDVLFEQLEACVDAVEEPRDAGSPGSSGYDIGTGPAPTCFYTAPNNSGLPRARTIDVLLMVDNSNCTAEDQFKLSMELEPLLRGLSTGDIDQDGTPEFVGFEAIDVGTINGDMGTGGHTVPTCDESMFGDDGVLRTRGNTAIMGCQASYPSFLWFEPSDGRTYAEWAEELTCVANMGTDGCGFEQPLEAILKSLTPSSASFRFFDDTTGHADGANLGFHRRDTPLLVLAMTDEDDCSSHNPDLFNPDSTEFSSDLNLRCFSYAEELHPVERYVAGLLAVVEHPSNLLYATISGVPPELDRERDLLAILDHPQMQLQIDPAMPTRLTPSCNGPGSGLAFPSRRMLEVGVLLESRGAGVVSSSVCVEDYSSATERILEKLAELLNRPPCDSP